jgi:hypothetical protein
MTNVKGIVISSIGLEMLEFQRACDWEGFRAYAQKIKTTAKQLVDEDKPEEATEILTEYRSFFRRYEHQNIEFTKHILSLFPANREPTMKLLGISSDMDDYITHHKLDKTTFSATTGDIKHVLPWALKHREIGNFVEQFVEHIATDILTNHSTNTELQIRTSGQIVSAIAWDSNLKQPVSKKTDAAVASLVSRATSYALIEAYWVKLARSGLHETLLKMMEYPRINRLTEFSPEDYAEIIAALPKHPTPEQAHWITQAMPHPELERTILFDPAFDLDRFIEAMRARTQTKNMVEQNDLTFKALSVFKHLMTPEHLDTVEKRRRVSKLLDAAADNHFNQSGSPRTSKHVREEFDKQGLPPTARRLIQMLKGQEIHEDLGL